MRRWLCGGYDKASADELKRRTGLPDLICRLLSARNMTDPDAVNEYFNGVPFSDPFLIKDMDKAISAVENALESGDKMTVYGDYDCDGITAAVMLTNHLTALGGEVELYIPQREDGYGLNIKAVEDIAQNGTKLIITVDNGISAVNEAEKIYELGMKLVITDHHAVPDVLPRAEAIVDPHRPDDNSPCKYIAGCGVALKLITALERDTDSVLEQYADLACIGTVGDIVPLVGENREIVKRGLEIMQYSENEGLNALISAAGLSAEGITAGQVAFGICPRINAAGRYGDAMKAARLFTQERRALAEAGAEELCRLNDSRKQLENDMLSEALAQLNAEPERLNSRVIIVSGEGWRHGIIGLVSARLTERFGKPSIVIGIENGDARGSVRSIEGFSAASMLTSCADWLTKFGGHERAGGFSIDKDRIDEFRRAVQEYAKAEYPVMPHAVVEADIEPDSADTDVSAVEMLKYMQPFGEGNPAPLFLMKNCAILSVRKLKDGKYTSFEAEYMGRRLKFLCFSISYADFCYRPGDKVDVIANLEVNEYNGNKSVSVRVKDLRASGIDQDRFFAACDAYEKIIGGERIDPRLISRIMPTVEDMKMPFDLSRRMTSIDKAAQYAVLRGMNYCKFMMCLHIFAEFGHLKLDRVNGTMEFIRGGRRISLDGSAVVKRIKRACGAGSED